MRMGAIKVKIYKIFAFFAPVLKERLIFLVHGACHSKEYHLHMYILLTISKSKDPL